MTAYSTAGALKAYVESLGTGVAAYRDGAPTTPTGQIAVPFPFVTILEAVSLVEDLAGEQADDPDTVIELAQVDLWQEARRNVNGRMANVESYSMPETIGTALRRPLAFEAHAPWHVYDLRASLRRLPPSENLVRHTWTVTITRDRARKP